MNIALKLTPFMSDQYALEKRYLRFPVSFTYEDREGAFVYDITDGLPIIGKPHPETRNMAYFIGDVCTIDQLSDFITNLSRGLASNIVFSETDESINSIEYDPSTELWCHKTGSKIGNYGSTLKMKISGEILLQFKKAMENYRRFAFMTIEGHRRLSEEEDKD